MTVGPWPLGTIVGAFLLAFPTLFSIINPIGSSLVFYNVTSDRSHAERRYLAGRIAFYSLAILLGSIWMGGYILSFFGVSLGALRIGGGLVVSVQAWNLLLAPEAQETQRAGDAAPAAMRDEIAFFPLTMPLTTGPGSISVAIALASVRPAESAGVIPFFFGMSIAAALNAFLVWILYVFSDRVLSLLGPSGARVLNRLAAFLLLCIGVQIIITGGESVLTPLLHAPAHAPAR